MAQTWAPAGVGTPQRNTCVNRFETMDQVPARTPLSERISKDLQVHGFRFVGPVIVYAYMQSIGLVNDHVVDCFRHPNAERSPR